MTHTFDPKMTFKEQSLDALRKAYPNGVGTAHQHRDAVRLYLIGWMDSLAFHGNADALRAMLPEANRISDPNWWPDGSWAWWSGEKIIVSSPLGTPLPKGV